MTLPKIILALAMIPLFGFAFFHYYFQSKSSTQKADLPDSSTTSQLEGPTQGKKA